MKKFSLFLLLALFLLALAGCAGPKAPAPEPVIIDGQEVRIDQNTGTIAHGEDVYQFTVEGGGGPGRYSISITYPNGEICSKTYMDGGIATNVDWDDGMPRREGYIEVAQLEDLIMGGGTQTTGRERNIPVLVCLVLIGGGAWSLFGPRSLWYINYGWRYKDVEPSDLALALYRVGGGLALFFGLLFLIVG